MTSFGLLGSYGNWSPHESSHVTIPSVDSIILPQQLPVTLERNVLLLVWIQATAAANLRSTFYFFPLEPRHGS